MKKALAGHSGETSFYSDGTMAAGIPQYVVYHDPDRVKSISCFTMTDACQELGVIPQYVKMDIEGAEVAVLKSDTELLSKHPIHFSIESNHLLQGSMIAKLLEPIFRSVDYVVESSEFCGTFFTLAKPKQQ